MGCFTVLRSKKKKSEQTTYTRRVNPQESSPTTLPEPHVQTRTLQSAPSSFNTRAKPVQPLNMVTNSRTRALSAPSNLNAAEQEALSSTEGEEHEQCHGRIGSMKEQRSPSPQPLPLPSPQLHTQSASALKTMGSFKSVTSSGPLNPSGPLPLPPSGTLRNFSYEELAAACHNFSRERCMSEGFSSVIYRASFGDDNSGFKKLEATVTHLHLSTQVMLDCFFIWDWLFNDFSMLILHHTVILCLTKKKNSIADTDMQIDAAKFFLLLSLSCYSLSF